MDRFAETLRAEDQRRLRPTPPPVWIEPMLATLTDTVFSDIGWLFERKLDGERCLAFRDGADVRLYSRNRKPLGPTYPEIVDALVAQETRQFVIDGEIVAFDGRRTSFSRLQQRLGITDPLVAQRSPVAVVYYVFDVLHVSGFDTTQLPVRERKRLLTRTLTFRPPLRYTPHRNATGGGYFTLAAARGWEGLIAKRADAPYVSGRSADWLKLKADTGQELVVGGFTEPSGSREGIGALLVGYYDDRGRLQYAGKVGTGYSNAMLRELRRRLDALETPTSPFHDAEIRERGAHWARPEMVAEIGFTEWTKDGKLRHPRFKGLRNDKAPRDVVRERPPPRVS